MPTWSLHERSGLYTDPMNSRRVWRSGDQLDQLPHDEFCASGTSVMTHHFSDTSKVINLRGFIFDSVGGLGSWPKPFEVQQHLEPILRGAHENNAYGSEQEACSAIWQTTICGLQRVGYPVTVAPRVFRDVMIGRCLEIEKTQIQERSFQTLDSLPETAFAMWYHCNRELKFAGHTIKDWIRIMTSEPEISVEPRDTSPCRSLEDVRMFEMNVDCAFKGRRIMTSIKGYLGMVPRMVKPGDLICILLGGKLPIILRPAQDSCYAFIGECYVHDLVWGEAMVFLERGEYELRDFAIC